MPVFGELSSTRRVYRSRGLSLQGALKGTLQVRGTHLLKPFLGSKGPKSKAFVRAQRFGLSMFPVWALKGGCVGTMRVPWVWPTTFVVFRVYGFGFQGYRVLVSRILDSRILA